MKTNPIIKLMLICWLFAGLLFPMAAGQRLMRRFAGIAPDKTDTQPWPPYLKWLNRPFQACLSVEAGMLSMGWTLPFGLSAICIGIKPARAAARS